MGRPETGGPWENQMAKRILIKPLGVDEGYLPSPKGGSWNAALLPVTNVTAGKILWVEILSPSSGTFKFRDLIGQHRAAKRNQCERFSVTSLPST